MGFFTDLFGGGNDALARAQNRATINARKTARSQAVEARKERRAAIRAGVADRKAAAAQNRALVEAERQSAKALEELNQERDIRTEVIDDEEAKRRKVAIGARRSAYGFSRPSGNLGLGGGPSNLG